MSDEVLVNLREFCQVTEDRAKELLEAANGVLGRAIEIHLEQQQQQQQHAPYVGDRSDVAVISIGDGENNHGNKRSVAQSRHSKTKKKNTSNKRSSNVEPLAAKKPRKDVPAKAAKKTPKPSPMKQGTLHTFLGIPKPKTSKQQKISSFFARKNNDNIKTEMSSSDEESAGSEDETSAPNRDAMKGMAQRQPSTSSSCGRQSPLVPDQGSSKRAESTAGTNPSTTQKSSKGATNSQSRLSSPLSRRKVKVENEHSLPAKRSSRRSSPPVSQARVKMEQEHSPPANSSPTSNSSNRSGVTSSQSRSPLPQRKVKEETEPVSPTKLSPKSRSPATHSVATLNHNRIKQEASSNKQAAVDPRLLYSALAEAFTEMTSTTKRNVKLNTLKTAILGVIEAVGGIHGDPTTRNDDAQILMCALELISGKVSLPGESETVAPAPLQVSGAAVSTAVQTVTGGVTKTRLREAYRRTGDLGDAAAEFFLPGQSVKNFFVARSKVNNTDDERSKETPVIQANGASITKIHSLLQSVATVRQGTGSQKERQTLLVKLLRLSTTKEELRFLVRTLLGNMRLGATTKSILASLAMAIQETQTGATNTQDAAIETVQKTFDICPRLDKIAISLLCGGVERMVKECTLEVGIPIQPMLANPAHSLEEVEKLMEKSGGSTLVAEWKYDGMRCQAHFDGMSTKLFSRHLLDTSSQFPDACRYMLQARNEEQVQSFIIDSEIVGVASNGENCDTFRLLPFQILSTRRGNKGGEQEKQVQICVFAFDVMYLNGASLLDRPLFERQRILREHFHETPGFTFASSLELPLYDQATISSYLQAAVQGGAEGLMVKLTGRSSDCKSESVLEKVPCAVPRCTYESGTRSQTWLKVKRDYVSGFADTIDVVPIGAWYGSGRKGEKRFLSPVLLAVYDEEDGVFRSISRCLSFTDDMYNAVREFYFNGSPYPESVGLGESSSETANKSTLSSIASNKYNENDQDLGNKKEPDSEGSDESNDGMNDDESDKSDGNNDFVGVNCFPGRPSNSVYITNENPPIWFKPFEVWEVSFADLTLSRVHMAAAGLVDDAEGRGVSIRFPRFKRRRPDKNVEQATTTIQIAQLFAKQFKQH